MHTRSFNYQDFINIFGNIESTKIGFYCSFSLHLLFLILVIGFPNIFKSPPINIPTVIPIEILNVEETTSISEKNKEKEKKESIKEKPKQKKFNNLQSELSKNVEIKTKPENDLRKLNIKEKKQIKQDIQGLTEIDKDIVDIQEERFESLPTKKIKPRIKPKPAINETVSPDTDINLKPKPTNTETAKLNTEINVKIKSKPRPNFDIASMLKDLRNDQMVMNKETIENKSAENMIIKKNESDDTEAQLSISEIDLLIQQLSACWAAPAGAVIKPGMAVKISANIKPNRMILHESVRIIDTNISKSNPFYGPITESAMRTLLNPECNPLRLPVDKYDLWKDITIIFDHSIMKGYQ